MPNDTVASPVLVLGGQRSGKSALAERLVLESRLAPVYIATAEAGDGEMAERIARHRERRGPAWRTVEEPLDIPAVVRRECARGRAVLVDGLGMWLANLLGAGRDPATAVDALREAVRVAPGLLVLVSEEAGLGVVPENALARRFVDLLGAMNQGLAACCRTVVFVAAGLPLALKGTLPPALRS
jgi:adenosylcobinamide kinase/adenosylcobinamide-phosphate guanylyltransferase